MGVIENVLLKQIVEEQKETNRLLRIIAGQTAGGTDGRNDQGRRTH